VTFTAGEGTTTADGALWERSPQALWRRLSEGVAVLPRDGSSVTTLEGLHAEVWGALARASSIQTVVDQLGDRLSPDASARHRVAADAVRFLVAIGAVRESLESSESSESRESLVR
jgi:hypothetical protein